MEFKSKLPEEKKERKTSESGSEYVSGVKLPHAITPRHVKNRSNDLQRIKHELKRNYTKEGLAKKSLFPGSGILNPSFPSVFDLQKYGKFKGSSIDDYTILKLIGKGAYAEVWEGVHNTSQESVALKIYDKACLGEGVRKGNLLREIRILESLNHPNVVKIYDCIDTAKKVVVVLEFIKGVSLKKFLSSLPSKSLTEKEAVPIFRQIVSGVAYCHSKNISHRDITLDNILIASSSAIKIIDFGFGISITEEKKAKLFCGTPIYMAPELILKRDYKAPLVDVWALGIILYYFLSGDFPFKGEGSEELGKCISIGKYVIPAGMSESAKDLISHMLDVDIETRFTALKALQHEFLAQCWGAIPIIKGE